ncbi:uncharacterized protein LOC129957342 [Argiope bruennichi]|uniref:TPM domain-containing protein n=1 Tax=Argiope bruennichi TaxID=94029 RepID=A0A8T0FB22_ARGBR|nr:uncharacterized protein LOC129957342 [Argiope bruennichi]XP_055925594.1 uncharacterized protein LOC129957342 [Argiope bruennichi]XP_055925595.1 uncharacterized protein LOC129957342 [Argiope bruennichi]KAF8788447.1 hypothetical protein HNY73_006491 [Argiope bruennichi]
MTILLLLLNLQLVLGGAKEFPNPQTEWRMCGMPRPAFVCDPHFILSRGDVEKLDQIASEFRKSTSCLCSRCEIGVTLGIFLSHNISKEAATRHPTGKALAEMLRRQWALSPCGSDIVVVLLTHQNMSDFSLGPAVAKIFSESTATRIVSECRAHFESGWYYQGLESIANSFNDVLVQLQRQAKPVFKNLVLGIGLGFGVLLVLALTALLFVYRQNKRRRKSYCSDIYEGMSNRNNRRKSSFNQAEHLEKLTISEEDEPQFIYKPRSSSVHFARMNRQLSDVPEEISEDIEVLKYSKASYKENIPVTEL